MLLILLHSYSIWFKYFILANKKMIYNFKQVIFFKRVILYIFSLLFIISLNFLLAIEPGNIWEQWDSITIAMANTAAGTDYYTEEEQLIILYTNLARTDGPLFTATFLKSYMKNKSPSKYTRSLFRDLKKVKGFQPLFPEPDLYKIALGHAITSGKSGHAGHRDFDKRFKPVLGRYNLVAENCAYGLEDAMSVVIELLIDENVKDLGHRKNILNPDFNSIGVSIQPHKKFNHNCVMGFGRKVK